PSFQRMAGMLHAATILSFANFRDWAVDLLEDMWSPLLADLVPAPITHTMESVVLMRTFAVPSILKCGLSELI
ncbi:hypothetical protein B0H17DRAFT_889516, partial [Mycena rosella]